jgi:hypothetical protein
MSEPREINPLQMNKGSYSQKGSGNFSPKKEPVDVVIGAYSDMDPKGESAQGYVQVVKDPTGETIAPVTAVEDSFTPEML